MDWKLAIERWRVTRVFIDLLTRVLKLPDVDPPPDPGVKQPYGEHERQISANATFLTTVRRCSA